MTGAEATGKLFRPHNKVPVSGIYDIVDEQGNYLESQVTCHAGENFPPTANRRALDALERFRKAGAQGKAPIGPPFGYRLAFEAAHLDHSPPPQDEDHAIHRPGETVQISGVYNVVDLKTGSYLRHQRTCIGDREFPATEGPDPDAYGYRLQHSAEHLSDH